MRFLRIGTGVDAVPVLLDLLRAPTLWDQNRSRQTYPGSPHGSVSDIWVRYRSPDEVTSETSHNEPFRCVFLPAWRALPALRPLVFGLMARTAAVELGSILITRLAPGCSVAQHSDRGGWAPEFYNTKCHVTLSGTSLSKCDGETVTMSAGEVWTFDNLLEHSVENPGSEDRIVCIVSLRCEA
jgi:mannose-6-phosphate isomerase-like protein (cupin superfamily)